MLAEEFIYGLQEKNKQGPTLIGEHTCFENLSYFKVKNAKMNPVSRGSSLALI